MRIVQTFWTAGRDPLKYSFGWSHPEYNLMSWALSCLSLREHYDEVALYTDQEGYDVLINKMHLPYTEVLVVYDKNLCLPQHWAYAKIKTYSMQTKPFLHVDGDVYLPHPIPEDVANAPLIAQNKEIGTAYYRDMMYSVLHNSNIQLPKCVQKGLQEDSISSYNMGVFGGNDLQFVKQYCNDVQEFIDINGMNNSKSINSRIECNIFFEQILFAALVEEKKKKVSNIIKHDMYDQCYTVSEFCNLYAYNNYPLLHLLGGHKRNMYVQKMLRHTFAYKYPEMFKSIYECTKENRQFVVSSEQATMIQKNKAITHLYTFINQKVEEWSRIDIDKYITYESCFSSYNPSEKQRRRLDKKTLKLNPYLCIYSLSNEDPCNINQLKMCLHCERNFPLRDFAVFPELIKNGYELIPLIPLDVEIIEVVSHGTVTLHKVIWKIFELRKTDKTKRPYLMRYIKEELKFLIESDIIIVTNN
jgi:hypothetical protein